MKAEDHFDYSTNGNKPFLMGYRKFIIALLWTCLAIYAAIMVLQGWAPKRAGTDTVAIWLVGTAAFFCAFFVGGNVLVEYFVRFWKHSSVSNLTQTDKTEAKTVYKTVEFDSQEDAAWKEIEADEDTQALIDEYSPKIEELNTELSDTKAKLDEMNAAELDMAQDVLKEV